MSVSYFWTSSESWAFSALYLATLAFCCAALRGGRWGRDSRTSGAANSSPVVLARKSCGAEREMMSPVWSGRLDEEIRYRFWIIWQVKKKKEKEKVKPLGKISGGKPVELDVTLWCALLKSALLIFMRSVRGRLEGGDLHLLHPLGFLLQNSGLTSRAREPLCFWMWLIVWTCARAVKSALLMDQEAQDRKNTCCAAQGFPRFPSFPRRTHFRFVFWRFDSTPRFQNS